MILSLRQRHRRIFAVLGVLLPIALVVGIAARKPVPTVAKLPDALADSSGKFVAAGGERLDLFGKITVRLRVLRGEGTRRGAIALTPAGDFAKPDLLVYWVSGRPAIGERLPETATLLGAFAAAVLPLPIEAEKADGALILFSLADQEIVDISQPFSIPPEGRVPRGPDPNHGGSQNSSLRKE